MTVATVSEKSGKINFSRSENSQVLGKKSGKMLVLVKVSEKSGNFVGFVGKVKCCAFKIPWKT